LCAGGFRVLRQRSAVFIQRLPRFQLVSQFQRGDSVLVPVVLIKRPSCKRSFPPLLQAFRRPLHTSSCCLPAARPPAMFFLRLKFFPSCLPVRSHLFSFLPYIHRDACSLFFSGARRFTPFHAQTTCAHACLRPTPRYRQRAACRHVLAAASLRCARVEEEPRKRRAKITAAEVMLRAGVNRYTPLYQPRLLTSPTPVEMRHRCWHATSALAKKRAWRKTAERSAPRSDVYQEFLRPAMISERLNFLLYFSAFLHVFALLISQLHA